MITYTVHPRACGEQSSHSTIASHSSGSSPRVRGTAAPSTGLEDNARFIPARAGNRQMVALAPMVAPVHPRACGEQEL